MRQVRFTFENRLIQDPVIYRVGHEFKVVTNIRRADIQDNLGWVILELDGEEEEIERSMEWVRSLGVRVDPVLGDLVEG